MNHTTKNINEKQKLNEEIITSQSHILNALYYVKEHRYWTDTTFQSYIQDVKKFENFLMDDNKEPLLGNGEKLYLVHKWIKKQMEEGVAYKTISRRVASLSSIYHFCKELDIVKKNPFKAIAIPGSHSGSHSRVMDLDDMKKVYTAIDDLKKQGLDMEIPLKLLMFTGLRNHSLSLLKVGDINWIEEIIVYNTGIDNSKHKVQFLPIPPGLMAALKRYIEENNLKLNDNLCYGIKGIPLQNKQLNRITDKICDYLDWKDEMKVTPHAFRYSIATLLDERGVSRDSIKYLLGHSESESIQFYIRRDKRKIHQIKKALTDIETELEDHVNNHQQPVSKVLENKGTRIEFSLSEEQNNVQSNPPFSEEFLLELSKTNPQLLEKIMLHYMSK